MLLKNDKKTLPALEDGEADRGGGQERRRHRQPVRRLDDRLAGEERSHRPGGHHHPGRAEGGGQGRAGDVLQGRQRRRGRGRGRRRRRARSRTPSSSATARISSLAKEDLAAIANVKKAGIPVVVVVLSGRPLILGDALDAGGRGRRGLAARHGRPGRGRRAVRRLQADGQALVHVAAHDGADPDQRGRCGVRPAVPVRVRPDATEGGPGVAATSRPPRAATGSCRA